GSVPGRSPGRRLPRRAWRLQLVLLTRGRSMLAVALLLAQTAIPPAGGAVTGTTSGASRYSGSCAATPTANAPDAVFSWTPAASGTATFNTCSANTKFDTVLYVRSSLSGGDLACNDDTSGCATGDGSAN